MPRGPNGEWRPADPTACAVHVGRILTGEIAETFEAPGPKRPAPPDPAAGGRARAVKMSPEARAASAKRAAAARWGSA